MRRREPPAARRTVQPHMQAAQSVGLRYVRDSESGIRRVTGPFGVRYIGPEGRAIRGATDLRRIRALAVPPAWTDVWICRDSRGHVQATGRDARGRKQYRYHPSWRACRDETKFDRMTAFAAVLPAIRARTESDMARPGLPRAKVLAAVVQLLEKSLIRVGNEEYARQNASFGLTTLQDKHVDVWGGKVRFEFRGKSGVKHAVALDDRRLARIIKQCRDLPGQDLFQYLDEDGRRCDVTSGDVNAYLKEVTGQDFTAKDFRTWAGTVLCAVALGELDPVDAPAKAKKNVLKAIEAVAGVLGNTRTVCRHSYVHPAVTDAYMEGRPLKMRGRANRPSRQRARRSLRPEELAVLRVIEQRMDRESKRRRAA